MTTPRADIGIIGGSGLYVRGAIDALDFPGTDPEVRARLEAELADPHGVHVRPDGTLYFADSFNYRVMRLDP